MTDPHHLAPGNDAPTGTADASPGRVAATGIPGTPGTKLHKLGRFVTAGAAGTTSPLHRDNYAVATNRGYGDALGRGFELALTLAVLTGIGWLIDRQVGTTPIFTLVLSVVGFVGISVKLWIGYDLEMRKHDDGAIWNRGKAPADHDATGKRPDTPGGETMAS